MERLRSEQRADVSHASFGRAGRSRHTRGCFASTEAGKVHLQWPRRLHLGLSGTGRRAGAASGLLLTSWCREGTSAQNRCFPLLFPAHTHAHTQSDDAELNLEAAVGCWSAKTHRRDFVSVEKQRYAPTAVVQMPAVGLALGGRLRKRRAGAGADPPLAAGRREAREVAVLHTLLSGRARLLSGILVLRVEAAGPTTAQHLKSQINAWCFRPFPCCVTVTATAAMK